MELYERCRYCKSFSNYGGRNKGFCLRKKLSVRAKDYCGLYRPNVKNEYEQEAKFPSR